MAEGTTTVRVKTETQNKATRLFMIKSSTACGFWVLKASAFAFSIFGAYEAGSMTQASTACAQEDTMHSRINSLPITDLRFCEIKQVQLLHMDFIEVECFRLESRCVQNCSVKEIRHSVGVH